SATVLAVCAATTSIAASGSEAPRERPFELASPHLISPDYGGLAKPPYVTVRNREELRAVLPEPGEPKPREPAKPAADDRGAELYFQRNMLIVAAMGARPTAGYTVEISSMVEDEQQIVVTVIETSPGANCVTAQVSTRPIAVVKTAPTKKPFKFDVRKVTRDCD